MQIQQTRQEFRQHIRKQRRDLSASEQLLASRNLIQQCTQLTEVENGQHFALYLSTDGELDTHPLIEWMWNNNKSIYLPVIHPFSKGQLLFLKYQKDTEMVSNRYGILEPRLKKDDIIPVNQLDIIFTPLVGFDRRGHRLGMGGGYYDRTLEPWFNTGQGAIPIGLAHDCQFVDELPIESWDIPLPKIVTPTNIWNWE
ncbi:5-formyltetrahydrofolate cyclo-ligase [Vibrio viridaestus]|uniref:5-formyltetrahydrofolate cyclo-ligase n=1 Tax=Vibrio viridaestus TaxID=2487322 RepID=A0A3N9THT7_9VIBR|nr:5-formyltetrahydrofolate cyclo-ligase [Vibrio viridaestus]RQW63759.1 5-formyltetrahydrofolate cyclo-ligase [Vibrio viridaestus]